MIKRILVVSVLFALFLSGCGFSLAQDITPPPGLTQAATLPPAPTAEVYPLLPPSPASGKTAYQDDCAGCHGLKGLGDGSQAASLSQPPARLFNRDLSQQTSLAGWYDLITGHGTGTSMPDFSTVLDARIRWDISAYLYLLNTNSTEVGLGEQLYSNNCAQCHGTTGKGDGSQAASLTLSPPDFSFQRILTARTDTELVDIVSNGAGKVMPAYKDLLTREELEAVVKYVRTLSFAENPLAQVVSATENTAGAPTPALDTTATPQASSETVTVTGKLIYDTGTDLPAGQVVTLRIFDNMEASGSLATKTEADGSFRFDDVPMNSGRILIATTEFGGQTFNSDPSKHPTTDTSADSTVGSDLVLDIHVSDSTTDTSTISMERLHVFFDFSHENVVQIVELFLVSNSGNQTVVAADANSGVLNFKLPAGASNLQFQDSVIGQRYLATDSGFADTAPVAPGSMSSQVLFAFDLPYTGKADISLPIPYNTASIIVMAPLTGVQFTSDQLVDGGIKAAAENTYRVHTGSDFTAESNLKFKLNGKPQTDTAQTGSLKFNTAWIGAGVLVLVILGVLFYLYQTKKGKTIPTETHLPLTSADAIMDSIIALDAQFKAGRISESAYQQRRQELKEQLKKAT